jgi:GH35 family endo-1,4-beta-xylanase
VTRTKAYVSEWDVVNEPLENNDVQGTVLSTGVAQTNGVLGTSFPSELFNYTYAPSPGG